MIPQHRGSRKCCLLLTCGTFPMISDLRGARKCYRPLAKISGGTLRFSGARIGFPRLIFFRGLFFSAAYFYFWPTLGFSLDSGGWPEKKTLMFISIWHHSEVSFEARTKTRSEHVLPGPSRCRWDPQNEQNSKNPLLYKHSAPIPGHP